MRRLLPALLAAALLPLGLPAWAGDPEEDEETDLLDEGFEDLDGEDEGADDTKRLDAEDDLGAEDDEDALDAIDGAGEEKGDEDADDDDLLGGDLDGPTAAEQDDATVYRKYLDRSENLEADEEIPLWERYLAKYPETAFRTRIERRIDDLMESLYSEHVERPGGPDGNADSRELKFSQGLLLENINPRTRLQAGFEWGLPNYMNLFGSYEYQIIRPLSVHGGVRRRYTGWSLETGARYALVKSERTQTLVTFLGDLHFNANPAFIGIRPQLAFGKNFGDVLHVQAQAGVDIEARSHAGLRLIGGANVTWLAAENVAIFAETSVNMKNFGWYEGNPPFQFNIVSFGLKFFPRIGEKEPGTVEMNVGASAPYAATYWMYHFGSIMGQVNYYP